MNERHIDINEFDYDLPDGRIAKFPLPERSSSKLLVYRGGEISEAHFADMGDVLPAGQLLVFNNTKVIRARIVMHKLSGARIDVDERKQQPLDFALWKEARLMLGENYSTGYAWLGGKSESYYYYYMGIKQQFLKKKLDLSIMCNNPFEKYRRNRSTSDTPTFGGWSEYRYACRSLYFRVSYRFGKQNVGVKRTAKSIRNDDMSSGAQGGGGGSTGGAQGGGGM